jgi:hypothetical protein
MPAGQTVDQFEAAHAGHLNIQENQVRQELGNLAESLLAIVGFTNHFNALQAVQLLAKDFARDWFIVDD